MAPPLVVITSNSERRLPEPFLRRAVFHHIRFTDDLVREAVRARAGDFPELSEEAQAAAIGRFLELRQLDLRKKPATAELLVWLSVLSAVEDLEPSALQNCLLNELPALSALIKDREDLGRL